ncbi:helix-turn-helix domain-containing protein [Arthrobacter sp. KNU40]|uniref:AraC-like ligand-binding domain-containing protein n=1 Tax=Arthrobacter sp. KNU40 TaxID=3447965 RepID=UPI003F618D16
MSEWSGRSSPQKPDSQGESPLNVAMTGPFTDERATSSLSGWRDIMNQWYSETDFVLLNRDGFAADLSMSHLGNISMYRVRATELVSRRTPAQVAKENVGVTKMIWQKAGRCIVTQGNRRATVDTGDLVFLDFTVPYTVECVTPFTQFVLHLPTESISKHPTFAGRSAALRAVRLAAAAAPRPWLAFINELCNPYPTQAQTGIHASAMDAVSNLAAMAQFGSQQREPLRSAIFQQALHYIRSHCHEEGINSEAIAQAVNVSRRTLFRAFSEAGRGIEDCLLTARLYRGASLLENPSAELTVDSVARLSGFKSPSHFHAKFIERYNTTPGEYRAASR